MLNSDGKTFPILAIRLCEKDADAKRYARAMTRPADSTAWISLTLVPACNVPRVFGEKRNVWFAERSSSRRTSKTQD